MPEEVDNFVQLLVEQGKGYSKGISLGDMQDPYKYGIFSRATSLARPSAAAFAL